MSRQAYTALLEDSLKGWGNISFRAAVPETLYFLIFAFAHRALSVRSTCGHRLPIWCPPFTVLHSPLCSVCTHQLSVHYALSNCSAFVHCSAFFHLSSHSELRGEMIILKNMKTNIIVCLNK